MKEKELCPARKKTSIGGQALMEGIMMRGPKMTAMAVRDPQGNIVVEERETKGVKRPKICRLPIIRGIFGYIDSMTVGYKCLMRSAELAGLEDAVEKKNGAERDDGWTRVTPDGTPAEAPKEADQVEQSEKEEKEDKEEKKLPQWVMSAMMALSVVLSLALAIGIFIVVPMLLFRLLPDGARNTGNPALDSLIKSAFEGVIKIALLVAYMGAISLMKDIRRTFMYHGAEHKTIFCYEAGLPLTVENVRKQRRFHPRCGTSFLILMLIVSIFTSFFIDPISIAIGGSVLPTALRVVVKLALVPLIVGLGYELIKLAGRKDNWLTRVISAPGLWMQRITTREPDDAQIEVAIASLKYALRDEYPDFAVTEVPGKDYVLAGENALPEEKNGESDVLTGMAASEHSAVATDSAAKTADEAAETPENGSDIQDERNA